MQLNYRLSDASERNWIAMLARQHGLRQRAQRLLQRSPGWHSGNECQPSAMRRGRFLRSEAMRTWRTLSMRGQGERRADIRRHRKRNGSTSVRPGLSMRGKLHGRHQTSLQNGDTVRRRLENYKIQSEH